MNLEKPLPALIACSHGTSDVLGQAEVAALREQVSQLRPELDVLEAYVDVQEPRLNTVLETLEPGREAVVVPLLLSTGYHVKVDIPRAVQSRNALAYTVAADPLGPDQRLTAVLADALRQQCQSYETLPADVILAAAGSSDPQAQNEVERVAVMLSHEVNSIQDARNEDSSGSKTTINVHVAYGASAKPSIAEALSMVGVHEQKTPLAAYLLAHGYFYDQLTRAATAVNGTVTAPLLQTASDIVADIVLDRYEQARASIR